MNRNVESHFSMLPQAEISRSRFDRSFDHKTTFNVGELIPFFVDLTVMPGDTFDIETSKVVRLQTLLTPVMDNIYLDTYWFFVPYRLVWQHWRELMGENRSSAWLPDVEYSVPQIKAYAKKGPAGFTSGNIEVGSIFDYMGIPVYDGDAATSDERDATEFSFSSLAWRSYCATFNDWFRDENLTDPVNWSDGDADINVSSLQGIYGLDRPFKVAKYHDYFTSCLPSAQKGPPVSVPAGFNVTTSGVNANVGWPVLPRGFTSAQGDQYLENLPGTKTGEVGDVFTTNAVFRFVNSGNPVNVAGGRGLLTQTGAQTSDSRDINIGSTANNQVYISNLFAAPATNQMSGLSVLVNDLRYAFQLQKLYERDARGGTRYIELIKSHFGVSSPDARMQRPEYLGGNRIPISIHQITNQSQGESDFLGDLGAMSLTTDKHHDFVKSFTEHGVLIGLMCARYDHSYPQGLNRMWSAKSRFDFYWPVFANLGEEAVLKKEIMLTGTDTDDDVFGFQERWASYRYMPNRVSGEMRPGIDNTLDSWHFADYYSEVPTLSDGWIREDKTNVDRTLAVTSLVSNQIFCDIYVRNYTTRPMPLYSIPGLIDHH